MGDGECFVFGFNFGVSVMTTGFDAGFDVIVVGAGAAGLYSALCLPSHLRVGLVSKDKLSRSASGWAQGGIAAVVDPEDSTELHLQDTLQAGAGLCDEAAVRFLVETAPGCIEHLIQLGVAFDRTSEDKIALTLEAAHSRRRVLHAADTTGRAVVTTLTEHVLDRSNIEILSPGFVLDLWMVEGACQGVRLLFEGQIQQVAAKAVVLATGGGGQVFSQTTNPRVSTGDGVAIAARSGAEVRDLEFVQFHPTALMVPGAPRFLISEAVRGEGAHLVDASGRRFVFDDHPSGELAPRDVVSRSIFRHLQRSGESCVWLDLRVIDRDRVLLRFPNIIQVCRDWGVDVFSEPIPVGPAAHYWMGGVTCDLLNRSSLPGLYVVGETASTGVHGANRLASNSLLECVVFGAQLREITLLNQTLLDQPVVKPDSDAADLLSVSAADQAVILELRELLPSLLWSCAGITRIAASLEVGLESVEVWRSRFQTLPMSRVLGSGTRVQVRSEDEAWVRSWGELWNLLEVGRSILRSALFRTESRGGHFREDFPETSEAWAKHSVIRGDELELL